MKRLLALGMLLMACATSSAVAQIVSHTFAYDITIADQRATGMRNYLDNRGSYVHMIDGKPWTTVTVLVTPREGGGLRIASLSPTLKFSYEINDEELFARGPHLVDTWQSAHLRALPGFMPVTGTIKWRYRSSANGLHAFEQEGLIVAGGAQSTDSCFLVVDDHGHLVNSYCNGSVGQVSVRRR